MNFFELLLKTLLTQAMGAIFLLILFMTAYCVGIIESLTIQVFLTYMITCYVFNLVFLGWLRRKYD